MIKKDFKAVIFDMDGVLVDSEPHHITLEKELFDELGIEVSDAEHLSYMGVPASKMWEEVRKDKHIQASLEVLNAKHKQKAVRYFSDLADMEATEGLTDILEWLNGKGLPLAVASSSDRDVIGIILQKTGLAGHFSHIVCSDDVEKGKPAPDIYLHTASLLNVKPEECLVVEDSSNGIKAAKAAGMTCVAYTGTSNGETDTSMADEEIGHFSELKEIIRMVSAQKR